MGGVDGRCAAGAEGMGSGKGVSFSPLGRGLCPLSRNILFVFLLKIPYFDAF